LQSAGAGGRRRRAEMRLQRFQRWRPGCRGCQGLLEGGEPGRPFFEPAGAAPGPEVPRLPERFSGERPVAIAHEIAGIQEKIAGVRLLLEMLIGAARRIVVEHPAQRPEAAAALGGVDSRLVRQRRSVDAIKAYLLGESTDLEPDREAAPEIELAA